MDGLIDVIIRIWTFVLPLVRRPLSIAPGALHAGKWYARKWNKPQYYISGQLLQCCMLSRLIEGVVWTQIFVRCPRNLPRGRRRDRPRRWHLANSLVGPQLSNGDLLIWKTGCVGYFRSANGECAKLCRRQRRRSGTCVLPFRTVWRGDH